MLQQHVSEMIAEERIREAREEAARARLLRAALPARVPRLQRLAVWLAGLLIAAGTSMRDRYQAFSYAEREPDCSTC